MKKRRSDGRRCLVEGCARRVQAGRAVCNEHGRTAVGREVEAAVVRMTRRASDAFGEGGERAREEEAGFRMRLRRGDYGALFEEGARAAMAQAAAGLGVAEEVGALRLALARLLVELPGSADPVRLAHGVARLASASVRAVERHAALTGGPTNEFQATLWQVIDELDAEQAAARAAAAEARAATGEVIVSDREAIAARLREEEAAMDEAIRAGIAMAEGGMR